MLIVIAAPSILDPYYSNHFSKIIGFDIEFALKVMETNDNIIVLADSLTLSHLVYFLPDDILINAAIKDIWLRDFSPVVPSKLVGFSYEREDDLVQPSLNKFLSSIGIDIKVEDLKVDGGNVVDNNKDKVILTKKILQRNPNLGIEEIRTKLKTLLGVTEVAFIDMDDEYLGHSDGMVMFTEDNTIVTHYYEDSEFTD